MLWLVGSRGRDRRYAGQIPGLLPGPGEPAAVDDQVFVAAIGARDGFEPLPRGDVHQVDRNLDRETRTQISYELGHGRTDVLAAYIGSRV